ncbi:MAG: hypothetical protein V7K35_15210 [Nostoc sp.]
MEKCQSILRSLIPGTIASEIAGFTFRLVLVKASNSAPAALRRAIC